MRLQYSQFLAACRQTTQFLDAKASALGTIPTSGARKQLDDASAELESLGQRQGAHRKLGEGALHVETRLDRALRRQHMRPVVRIIKAKLPDVTELSAVRLPPFGSNSTALATSARELATAVEPYAAVFVEAGLPADFLDRIRAAADLLVQTVNGKGSHRVGRTGATDGLDKAVSKARKVVRVIDALVRAHLTEEDPLVTEWRNASRVVRGGSGALPIVAKEVPAV